MLAKDVYILKFIVLFLSPFKENASLINRWLNVCDIDSAKGYIYSGSRFVII